MPDKDQQYDIFISYSRKDVTFVQLLTKKLEELGYTYWIDVSGIESGDMFKKNIVKAIKASKVVVFISSKASNESSYTTKEINYALHNHKPIIPIRIDNTEYNEVLQFDLDVLDYVDCTKTSKYQEGFERLCRALQHYFPNHEISISKPVTQSNIAPVLGKKRNKFLWMAVFLVGVIGLGFGIWELFKETPPVLTFEYDYHSATVTGVSANVKTIVVPSSVRYEGMDYDITDIGEYAFAKCAKLKHIKISEGIRMISSSAFAGCASLESIELPSSLWCISAYAFSGCTNLVSIIIPEDVSSIEDYTFSNCVWLNDVELHDRIYTIKNGAFSGCANLRQIEIPNSVQYIGEYAFAGCGNLTEIMIPDKVTMIGTGAFLGCRWLQSITIGNNVERIDTWTFRQCERLENADLHVHTIGTAAFAHCISLSNVTIGDEVSCIEDNAFMGCSSLKSVTIPNELTNIGENAFPEDCEIIRR